MPSLTTGADHAADQDVTGCDSMPIAAPLGWPHHPLIAGRPNQAADFRPGVVPVAYQRRPILLPTSSQPG